MSSGGLEPGPHGCGDRVVVSALAEVYERFTKGRFPPGVDRRAERGQLAQRGPQASQADARLVDDVRRFRSFGHFTGIGQNLLQTIAQHRSHQRGAIGIPVDRQRLGLRW